MLKHLSIKNFTLIDALDIDFRPGFSVITGETGAGKSIILGAIALLLGQRADSKMIKAGEQRCVIEARFDLSKYDMKPFFDDNDIDYDEEDCIIRRELTAAGKSRAFINDTPAPLSMLKTLGERLMDVHSQHQNLLLSKDDFQLEVIDIIAGNEKQKEEYKAAFALYRKAARDLEDMKEKLERDRQNYDFVKFQCDELTNARLQEGEQEELEQQSDRMSHSEEIKSALYTADNNLSGEGGVISLLKQASQELQSISKVYPKMEEISRRIDSANIELKDIAAEVSDDLGRIDFDPKELDAVNERLDRIYELQKKYHADSVEELIARRDELTKEIEGLENSDDVLEQLQQILDKYTGDCIKKAETLSKTRQKASRQVEKEMLTRLVPLGLPNVRFEVGIEEKSLSPDGKDRVSFLFSANPGTPLQPVSQVASGGEIARVMLSLKAMISGARKLPTIIFDEIDTGVSGKVAEQMALIMKEMGDNDRQVISITHLPQIAATGSTHYKVFKQQSTDGTTSRMVMLSDEERVTEIAQMLSGSSISDAAVKNAKELLKR